MTFEELKEEWKALLLNGKIEEADNLYWHHLFPLVETRFKGIVDNLKKKQELSDYDWLIMPTGFDYVHLVLLIKALNPKKVFFLCTKEFKENFLKLVIDKTGIQPHDYVVETLEYKRADLSEAYRIIKNKFELFQNKRVAVDISRGKRVITSGATLMAALFGFDLIYIDETWINEIRRGMPGTEDLVIVKNPFKLFGELERNEAFKLFNNFNFSSAYDMFKEIKTQVIDPREFETYQFLAEAYNQWDGFNYQAALMNLNETMLKIRQYDIKNIDINKIKDNIDVLQILAKIKNYNNTFEQMLSNDNLVLHLLVDIYLSSLRRKEQGKYEDALTRLYRLLEMVSQYRLAKHGIYTTNVDKKALKKIEDEYSKLTAQIYGESLDFHKEIGLKEGHLIIFALKDELWKGKTVSDIKQFLGTIRLRDTSIIAHGIQLVSPKAFLTIEKFAKDFLKIIFELNKEDLEKTMSQHKMVKLQVSP